MKSNIITNLTFKQYQNKYKNYKKHLYTFTKKEVLDFDRQAGTIGEKYVLNKRRWALIGDTYYEIPKPIRPMWFKGLSAAGKLAACVIPVGVVGALGGAGYGIYAAIANNKTQVSDIEVIETGDTSELIENPIFKKQSNGDYVATLKMKSGHTILDIEEFHISVDGKELTKGEDFEFDISTNNLTIYGKSIPSKDSKITIKIKKAPEKVEIKFVPDEVEVKVDGIVEVKIVEKGTTEAPLVYPAEGHENYITVVTERNDEFTYTVKIKGLNSTKSFGKGYAVLTATLQDGTSDSCNVTVKDDVTEKVTITVNKDEDDGFGTVTGDGEYDVGSEVTLTATANSGSAFFGWIDSDNNLIKDNPLKIEDVYDDMSFKAVFGPSYLDYLYFWDNGEASDYCDVYLRDDIEEEEVPVDIKIPDQIKGKFIEDSTPQRAVSSTIYKINGIGEFKESKIKSIEIPLSLDYINANTFEGCGSLSKVTFVDSEHYEGVKNLKVMPYKCFAGCTNLKNITIPEGIIDMETLVFENSGLKTISLPSTLETFGLDVFKGTTLTSVEFKDIENAWFEYTNLSHNEGIFYPTDNGTENAKHLNDLTTNEGHLTNKCVVGVKANSTTISKGTEMKLTFDKLLPDEEIDEEYVYPLDEDIVSVSFKDGECYVKGESAGETEIIVYTTKERYGHIKFTVNEALSIIGEHNVDIVEAQKIGEGEGYYYDTNKEGATIEVVSGGDLISINATTGKLTLSDTAIANGGEATIKATKEGETPVEFNIFIGSFNKLQFRTDESSGINYVKKIDDSITGDVVIPSKYYVNGSGEITIQEFDGDSSTPAFGNVGIKNIFVPDTITKISESCFKGCTTLESITFTTDSTLKCIGGTAFEGCTSLNSITIPKSCDYIGINAFVDSGLTSAEFYVGDTWGFTNDSSTLMSDAYQIEQSKEAQNAQKLKDSSTSSPTKGYADYCWHKQNVSEFESVEIEEEPYYNYQVQLNNFKPGLYVFEITSDTIEESCKIDSFYFYHYELTFNSNNFKVYKNGSEYNDVNFDDPSHPTFDDLTLDYDGSDVIKFVYYCNSVPSDLEFAYLNHTSI